MRTLLAAFAITLSLLSAALPASAGYIAPDSAWTQQVFCQRGC